MPTPPIRIRPFRPDDTAAVLRLMRSVFRHASVDARIEASLGGTPWHRVKAAGVRNHLAAHASGCFVALAEARVVGFISTSVNPVASRGWIVDLAVASDCQGHGIGRRLIRRALAYFRRLGLHHAKIETLDTNLAGQHLYPSLGFVEVARQIHYVMPLE